jgi:hypothetical protein
MCAVATADLLMSTPPSMADLVAGKCTSDIPSYLLSIFAPPSRCCVFLSQLLPMLHAQSVSIAAVAVPALVITFFFQIQLFRTEHETLNPIIVTASRDLNSHCRGHVSWEASLRLERQG